MRRVWTRNHEAGRVTALLPFRRRISPESPSGGNGSEKRGKSRGDVGQELVVRESVW